MAMTACAAKFLTSSISLSVNGRTSLAVNYNRANQSVLLGHRYSKKGPRARLLDGDDAQRLTFGIGGISLEIRDMGDLLCARQATKTRVRARAYRCVLLPVLAIGWRNIVKMRRLKTFPVVEQKVAEFGFANPQSVREDRFEYRLHVARRCADDLKHLRGRRLLLQRLLEVARVLA